MEKGEWKHRHQERSNPKKPSKFLFNLKWLVVWTLIYTVLYLIFAFLLKELFGNFHFFQVKLIYALLIGLCFSISSRIIWSLIHNKHIYLGTDVFFFWTFAYAFCIWFGQFLQNLILIKTSFSFINNIFLEALIIGLVVCPLIKLIKKIEFGKLRIGRRRLKAPSQIMTGIILIAAGILTFRFSYIIFAEWFGWAEGLGWSWLLGFGLIIGGFLTLLAWWRNNVSMFTTKHHVKWN